MDRGTYVSASGGLLQLRKLDVVSNNLANVNTPGFKKQLLVSSQQEFKDTLAAEVARNDPYAEGDHDRTPGTMHIETVTDFSPGSVKGTANPLDVALRHPNDFFVVNTAQGQQYTRAGNFTLNENSELVTQDGYQVQGDGGAISISGGVPQISPNGQVRVNGVNVGGLQVVRFENPEQLERADAARFKLKAGQAQPETVSAEVIPESLEMANVSAISSVIDLITTHRAFDLYTRTAQSIDQMNQAAITQVGRPRG